MNTTAGPVLELTVFETENMTAAIPSALSGILLTWGAGFQDGRETGPGHSGFYGKFRDLFRKTNESRHVCMMNDQGTVMGWQVAW